MARLCSVVAVVGVAGLGVLGAGAQAAAAQSARLRVGNQEIDYGSAMSPAGEYADALASPEAAQQERLRISGLILDGHGKPVEGVTVRLFPLDEDGPDLILGVVGEEFGIANPAATTDAKGRFALTTGPLWKFVKEVALGLLHQRSPERPFDVGVLPVTDAKGAVRLALDGQKTEFDLGSITLVVAEPAKP